MRKFHTGCSPWELSSDLRNRGFSSSGMNGTQGLTSQFPSVYISQGNSSGYCLEITPLLFSWGLVGRTLSCSVSLWHSSYLSHYHLLHVQWLLTHHVSYFPVFFIDNLVLVVSSLLYLLFFVPHLVDSSVCLLFNSLFSSCLISLQTAAPSHFSSPLRPLSLWFYTASLSFVHSFGLSSI